MRRRSVGSNSTVSKTNLNTNSGIYKYINTQHRGPTSKNRFANKHSQGKALLFHTTKTMILMRMVVMMMMFTLTFLIVMMIMMLVMFAFKFMMMF